MGSNCIPGQQHAMIAANVIIGDNVAMMGGVALNHFARIGKYCFIGGYARIHHDAPPSASSTEPTRWGDDVKGLRGGGFGDEDIRRWKRRMRSFWRRNETPFATILESFDGKTA